jgi:polysaccharide biosynthesis transport protein
LTGTGRVEDAVRATPIPHLHLLPAGEFNSQVASALAKPSFAQLLSAFRGAYDVILLDSSPLLLVPDGFMIAQHVDGLILSVRPGVSQTTEVHAAYERLRDHRVPITGVVVNGVPVAKAYLKGYGSPAETTQPA